ncbi:TetR/AcrR family transcriptional regulator [Chitinophaga sp. XS-30]|uniref:TetR/AcrR family transcriptional regulator n=1 Tax=Chitinophaga sp. XS-30 TaxID=2604421 RepID=UPI001FED38C2|nr:TetR/AcrR family transcriptional regulator [Chitinophaga sp. XS-30]
MSDRSFIFADVMRTRDENKVDLIYRKAIEMIVHEGLDGFGVNKLAKAAGVSPATIYIYYKDREDLIMQVTLRASNHMLEESMKDFDPDMSFDEGMNIQWRNRARYFLKYPLETQFIEKMRYTRHYDRIFEELHKTFKEKMGRFHHNALERKELIKLPFEVFWSVAFAPLYQLIKFHTQEGSWGHKKYAFSDETMQQTLSLVLKALKP